MQRKWLIMILLLFSATANSGCRLFGQPPAWWRGFQDPVSAEQQKGLYALQPYQPGKIPVVFVHGLLSDPNTWHEMIADLRADPVISARYQFWLYRYPTGTSYVKSASEFRATLNEARRRLDPQGADPALQHMVLVGHSMGGLLCKLQVTYSDNVLWQAVSKAPLETLQTDARTRADLRQVFYFEPQPFVSRVVFIATPHGGSDYSNNYAGRLSAGLVSFSEEMQKQFQELVEKNNNLFGEDHPTRIPTSIDHLAPESNILQAVRQLRFGNSVTYHSIIGKTTHCTQRDGNDGVVDVSSAHLANAASAIIVPASHTSVHRHVMAFREVRRILLEHCVKARW